MSTSTPILAAAGVTRHYASGRGLLGQPTGTVRAVDGVDFSVGAGRTHALVGESGCGKSTLGRVLIGLEPPTEGTVRFHGRDVATLSRSERRDYQRNVQIVMQDPYASLNPRMTVGEIVREPFEVHGGIVARGKRDARVRELLDVVGLNPNHVDRYPHQFSGGQRQRISIARGIALEPEVLIADEAVSALDVSVQAQVLNLLQRLQEDLGLSYVFISHDLAVVRQIAHEVSVMYLGRVVEHADADALFNWQRHPYTRALLSAVPTVGDEAPRERIVLSGQLPSPANPPDGCNFRTRCPIATAACAAVDPALEGDAHEVACITPLPR